MKYFKKGIAIKVEAKTLATVHTHTHTRVL